MLRNLKRTEDATPSPATSNVRVVCDLALALAPAVLSAYAPEAEAAGSFPGTVPLPSTFYRHGDQSAGELMQPMQLTDRCRMGIWGSSCPHETADMANTCMRIWRPGHGHMLELEIMRIRAAIYCLPCSQ